LGVADPAIDPYVIAVGAADTHGTDSYSDDSVAAFSDYGNLIRDPDLVAPGVHIASLRVPGSYIDQQYGGTAQVGGRFFRGSGTSQAAAVVTGGAALLLQQRPWLTPDQLKLLLTSNADRLGGLLNLDLSQGHGELDLRRASYASASYTHQWYVRSTGLGVVELSRGTKHVVWSGVSLTGEQDIFLDTVNTAAVASQEADATAWSAGDWNGGSWSGGSWSGGSWSSTAWSGGSWSGGSWSGGSWSSNQWTGGSWSGGSWSGGSWSDAAWSSATWS
jgi:serine protease AprX